MPTLVFKRSGIWRGRRVRPGQTVPGSEGKSIRAYGFHRRLIVEVPDGYKFELQPNGVGHVVRIDSVPPSPPQPEPPPPASSSSELGTPTPAPVPAPVAAEQYQHHHRKKRR